MKKNFGLLILFSLLVTAVSAQKLKGKIDFLKGQEEVNLVFDFSNLSVNGKSVDRYIKDRTNKKSEEETASWIAEWEGSARDGFKELYTKYCNDELDKFDVGVFPDAEYTIIVKIDDIDPGNFAGPFSNPAKIKSTVNIIKTGEETILASITGNDDYNNYALLPVEFHRITAGFGEAGKELAKFLNKKL